MISSWTHPSITGRLRKNSRKHRRRQRDPHSLGPRVCNALFSNQFWENQASEWNSIQVGILPQRLREHRDLPTDHRACYQYLCVLCALCGQNSYINLPSSDLLTVCKGYWADSSWPAHSHNHLAHSSRDGYQLIPMNGQLRATPFRVVFAGMIQRVAYAGQILRVV